VVERLKAAGAIILGKTTTPEFGFKGVTDSPVTGITRNPWDLERTPGGSSGGAGVAVATGMGPLAVGTDGGGSIRIPSSFCGIYGLKPHLGRVPVYPASTIGDISHAGPMTRTVRDAALMLNAIAGADDQDRLSLPTSHSDYLQAVEEISAGCGRGALTSGLRSSIHRSSRSRQRRWQFSPNWAATLRRSTRL
jgi:aspartyl-tRNA(Asn)/glutamyl-tRNA(Gln) amidotransferase subunit A